MNDLRGLEDAGQTGGGMTDRAQVEHERAALELDEASEGRREESADMLV